MNLRDKEILDNLRDARSAGFKIASHCKQLCLRLDAGREPTDEQIDILAGIAHLIIDRLATIALIKDRPFEHAEPKELPLFRNNGGAAVWNHPPDQR